VNTRSGRSDPLGRPGTPLAPVLVAATLLVAIIGSAWPSYARSEGASLDTEGGGHDPERLTVLCGAHHKACHEGALCIGGTATGGFVFRHADGTPYGAAIVAPSIRIVEQVLGALAGLGFKPTRARALVDALLEAGAPADTEGFLRAALEAS
jgi:Holliday junction resolvase RuvA-like protein